MSFCALWQILSAGIPQGARNDIWARVWNWVAFIHEQPYLPFNPLDRASPGIFLILSVFLTQPEPDDRLYSMGGLPVVVATIWKQTLQPRYQLMSNSAFADVCKYLALCAIKVESNRFDELVEGTGGDLDDLCLVVIRHIELSMRSESQRGVNPPLILLFFHSILAFLINAQIRKTCFLEALVTRGIITALVSAMYFLETSTSVTEDASSQAEKGWAILEGLLLDEVGWRRTNEALKAGLLRAIVSGCENRRTCNTLRSIANILTICLPAATVYHTGLTQIKLSLADDILKLANGAKFKATGTYAVWNSVHILLQHRLELLDWYDTKRNQSYKGCADAECSKIRQKSNFQRCGRCLSVYYCSKACQRRDWHEGEHRRCCDNLRNVRARENEAGMTARNRSFMRILMQHIYETGKSRVLLLQISFLSKHPDEPFCTVFDFTFSEGAPGPSIGVVSVTDHLVRDVGQLANFSRREKAGVGRVESHVLLLRDPQRPDGLAKLFPMWSTSSKVQVKLKDIATLPNLAEVETGELDRCPSSVRDAVVRLAKEQTATVLRIH
ncbi:hypothetical protein C8R43DRAFT_1190283 [Mycena crocata]|nr:hypothetical protein C8R43DRAFT_1190283 [Mycena crocata]